MLTYRREIDGLRAVAVIPVILFHADYMLFRGGFVGVDIFFVISGFLITSLILSEMESGRFSILRFYERRARRILPALFLVVSVAIPFAWFWMPPFLLHDFAQSFVAVTAFSSNILFWMKSGYFEAAADEVPLLHTWSLAVEEQFYVFFPLFLMFAWKLGGRRLLGLVAIMCLASLGLSEWGWRNHAAANFYLIPFRAWELFLGVLIALYLHKRNHTSNPAPVLQQIASAGGLALILAAIFVFDEKTPFPSIYALIPTLGTALIILFANPTCIVGRLLSHKVFVGIGLISYSAYLWHQPLLAFARIRTLGEPSQFIIGGLCLVTFAFAYLSWRYVERPFRDRTRFSQQQIFGGAIAVSALFVGAGLAAYFNSHRIAQYKMDQVLDTNTDYSINLMNVEKLKRESRVQIAQFRAAVPLSGRSAKPKLLILGDSHGNDLFNALMSSNLGQKFAISIDKLEADCLPGFSKKEHSTQIIFAMEEQRCSETVPHLINSKQLENADVVVLSPRWTTESLSHLHDFLVWLKSLNKEIVLAERTAEFESVPMVAYNFIKFGGGSNREFGEFLARYRKTGIDTVNERVRRIATSHGLPTFSKLNHICPPGLNYCDGVSASRDLYFFDYGHWTTPGATIFGRRIAKMEIWDELLEGAKRSTQPAT